MPIGARVTLLQQEKPGLHLSVDLYDVSSSLRMEKIKYTTTPPLDHL